jgi:hypothetical protein
VSRHHQLLDSADSLVDEPAQLGGAVVLGVCGCTGRQEKPNRQGRTDETAVGRRPLFS